ncbi:MAG: c-type cytochrome domain-containing protein [Pirellulales bacterium]
MRHRWILALVLATVIGRSAAAAEPIDYVKQIEPIFVAHCAKCHGEAKAQAKLRLNTAAGLQEKLAADPKLIVAGKPDESELYQRLVLPADNSKRMPKGADPLPEADVKLIAEWITQGAALAVATTATPAPAPAAEPAAKAAEKPPLPEVAAAPQAAIDKLTAAGARVMPLFAGSNLLDVSFAPRSEPAGDAEVALLTEVADQVYTLNLANTKATAAGLAPLANLKNLAQLHLEHAAIDDSAIPHLSKLERLEYLNLYGTAITDANLKQLGGLKHLARLYLWQTKVSYDTAMSLEKDIPGLEVNLGYDHPVVAKNRLTKELEGAKQQLETAKTDQTKLEAELDRAKKGVEAGTARVAEIEKELGALEKPANGT